MLPRNLLTRRRFVALAGGTLSLASPLAALASAGGRDGYSRRKPLGSGGT